MTWTTPEEIRRQLQRHWDSGALLAARLPADGGEPLFPLALRLRRPTARDITERFAEVAAWVRRLRNGSRDALGHGYVIEFRRQGNRVQGSNELPAALSVPDAEDALRLLGRRRDAERFDALAAEILARQPRLAHWLRRRPLKVLEHEASWPRLLAVLEHFQRHPRPGCYPRQLAIPGVDTKFIEARRGLLATLLDEVLPASAIDAEASGVSGFNQRFGLRSPSPLVRLRLLDPALQVQGLSDLSLPAEQFARFRPAVERVFITENQTNGLAFPEVPRSLVVFGLGYGLEHLVRTPWLREVEVHYWGDIDTHGFGILDRVRATLPEARSLLMDRQTLLAHRSLWGEEPADKRLGHTPSRLTDAELALFLALRDDAWGERIRLEQERIDFDWLQERLGAACRATE
ncbi:Wadjet anti-phage system protein JetD domain-containing protein [Halomonas sp. A11-A]|jgi:hypothetical protein|uniref:Wadjet anti-phage system protein JetD domain-containing protein n=1 Tax=Halomonas sp. A11-A TaxID=2183985 RepID=UPI000D70A6D7|nr:Wadjet anti-phage system protein JetD domain-containing protein [Halomonas sp. A11-A]PWV71797.1 hypothetical protein DER72_12019 [Halomonas sp. A11-A]